MGGVRIGRILLRGSPNYVCMLALPDHSRVPSRILVKPVCQKSPKHGELSGSLEDRTTCRDDRVCPGRGDDSQQCSTLQRRHIQIATFGDKVEFCCFWRTFGGRSSKTCTELHVRALQNVGRTPCPLLTKLLFGV